MKYYNLHSLSLIIIISTLSSCSKLLYQNKWQKDPADAFTNQMESEKPLRYYDEETRLQYNVTNDAENLYIFIQVTDQQNQVKILRDGIQIWIDSLGRNKKSMGIFYPIPESLKDSTGKPLGTKPVMRTSQYQKENENPLKTRFENQPKALEITGFRNHLKGRLPLQNNFGITAKLDWDTRNYMNYEVVVPFSLMCKNAFYDKNRKPRVYSIIVYVPATSRSSKGSGKNKGVDNSRQNFGPDVTFYGSLNNIIKITMKIKPATQPD
jgi:hypothetical protein